MSDANSIRHLYLFKAVYMPSYLCVILLISSTVSFSQEDCYNGVDDDADGLTDLNDSECNCDNWSNIFSASSLLANYSFETMDCCPTAAGMVPCAPPWLAASSTTPDYFNTCGITSVMGSPDFPIPGEGDGYVGFFDNIGTKEYIGSCLSTPLTAGTEYTLNLWMALGNGDDDFTFCFYGTPNCSDMPWPFSNCPIGEGEWALLGSTDIAFTTVGEWVELSLSFTPAVNINAISFGADCALPIAGGNYYYLDGMVLSDDSNTVSNGIYETGEWCSENLMLSAEMDTSGGIWQWYFEGVALPGETSHDLDVMSTGAGTYQVVYTLGAECFMIDYTLEISTEDIPLEISFNNPSCFGYSDGSVTVNITGDPGDEVYVIEEDATGMIVNIEGSNTANMLGAGFYNIEATNSSGCSGSATVFLDEPEALDSDMTLSMPVCYGDQNGYAVVDSVLNAQGDLTNITYIWNPDPPGISGVGSDSIWNLSAGVYTLIINDDNGCSNEITFEITEPDELIFSEIGYEPAFCRLFDYQSGNGVVFASASGGTPDYSYQWENLATGDTWIPTTWGGLNPGDYQMTVVDDAGCILTQIVTVDSLNPIADFDVTSSELNGNLEGTAVVCATFTNQSSNFSNPNDPLADTTFFWNLDTPDALWQLTHNFFETFDTCYTKGGEYLVCLVAQNKNGCVDTTCKTITVFTPFEIENVNIFTPNGDGSNDVFTFDYVAKGVKEFHCLIVNRWGVKMSEIHDIHAGWDGKDKSGSTCHDGVYFYTYEGKAENDEPFSGQGTIQIVGTK